MVSKRLTLANDRAVSDAVDELIAVFGVLDDTVIQVSEEGFDRKRAPRLKDGGTGRGAASASPDVLWGKKRRSS